MNPEFDARKVALAIVAIMACAAVVWLVTDDDSESGGKSISAGEPELASQPLGPLTADEKEEARRIVLDDPRLNRLIHGSRIENFRYTPWASAGRTQRLGAIVKMKLDPPVRWRTQRLPVRPTDESTRRGFEASELFVIVSASQIRQVTVHADFTKNALVEITPDIAKLERVERSAPVEQLMKELSRPGY